MVLEKKFEIFPCFYFLQKTASKMCLAMFYKVKKLFLNLVHDSDCIKKNYKEQQALYHHFMVYTELNFYRCC